MASIADYLIYVAHDPARAARHNSGQAEARGQMTQFGLTTEQQDVILSRNHYEIADAIAKEMPAPKIHPWPNIQAMVYLQVFDNDGNAGTSSDDS
jgi:acetyl-CoA acetyltransferase